MNVNAVQTSRYDARGHRIIAVDVAGERYFTIRFILSAWIRDRLFLAGNKQERKKNKENIPLTPPAPTPPNLPTPQSPKTSATSSRIIFASKLGVRASDVGAWIRSWDFVANVVEADEGEEKGSG
jgi:hypothetical protein